MKFAVDTHTHTYASGHAYSTLIENARAAKEHGLKLFCTTDHAPSMPGAPYYWFFINQKVLSRFIEGVGIIRGIEANVMNVQGEIDVHPEVYPNIDWVIASFHPPVCPPTDKATHTETLINVIKSGHVDALGHLGNPAFDFDFEKVITCARDHHVAIEINNSSLKGFSREGSKERCYEIARVAKEIGAYITTGSDCHFCDAIGKFTEAEILLETVGVPEEQVITTSARRFLDFLELRGHQPVTEFVGL